MELYVGLDVSLKETSICVVDGAGEIVCEGTVISEPEAIAEFVKTKAPQAKRIGLETGPTSICLHRKLLALAREDKGSRRSMTVPGIGPITALAFHSVIDEPARFRRSRSVAAYIGLTPRR